MRFVKSLITVVTALALPALGQNQKPAEESAKSADKKPSDAEMMAMMMEMAKPGENHKLLQSTTGTWTYTVKWWMSPDAPPSVSSGTTVYRSVMGGRYIVSDHTSTMQMPGPDGKMTETEFKGMGVEGYDNAKKKFVASWIDNMGTGIMYMEGTWDPTAKTITYVADYEPAPGMKTKVRQVIKIADADHRTMQFFQEDGGKDVKTMEISYTRKT
jgi:hypothetical protein